MLLSVTNLDVRYGVISALQDVSLHINRGEIVTLIGSNGAGKTTLLRTISGLIRPERGTIAFDPAGDGALARLSEPARGARDGVVDYATAHSGNLAGLQRMKPHE